MGFKVSVSGEKMRMEKIEMMFLLRSLYLSSQGAIYRQGSRAVDLKVCCGRTSCLIEFVSQFEEWAYVASEHGRQVVDLEGPLPWSGYPTEVFHCSWLRHLSVRSILFS